MMKTSGDSSVEWCEVNEFIGSSGRPVRAAIIREIALDVFVDGERMVSIACVGEHIDELAVGFLLSEGLIRSKRDIAGLQVSEDGRAVRLTRAGSCANKNDSFSGPDNVRSIASSGAGSYRVNQMLEPLGSCKDIKITPAAACSLMRDMISRAVLHEETRGTHCAALADSSGIIAVREDIGRHNAVDMLAGNMLLNDLDASRNILVRTGRFSAEIIHKIWTMGIPIVISISVPTSAALSLARQAGITVIGSVRGDKMTIYHDKERVCI